MRSNVWLWSELTREDLRRVAPTALTVLPVASTEQHGPHLPTVTDTALVDAVLDRACELIADVTSVLRAPTLCYGSSDHHLPFGGTLSLTSTTFERVLRDLLRSCALAGCIRVFVLNGHGGNEPGCRSAAADAAREHGLVVVTASYWQLVDPSGDGASAGHAGEFETSMMLAVEDRLVRLDRARPSPGVASPTTALPGLHVDEPGKWERIDGFTDDPTRASLADGETQLERHARALAEALDSLAGANGYRR